MLTIRFISRLTHSLPKPSVRLRNRRFYGLRRRFNRKWRKSSAIRRRVFGNAIGKTAPKPLGFWKKSVKRNSLHAGFVVANDRIERARVLIYRESRGMEVRYPAFLRQFDGVQLLEQRRLSKRIDGIAGATLSVWAMERMARSALYFHRHVQK